MSEQWNQWEGQTIDGKFLLHKFLGATDHSAVFLTELSEPQPGNAAIKFLAAGSPADDARLALWKRATHLSHPNLLCVFDCGRCRMGDRNLLYVVVEYAEENLGEILPQRALTAEEVRDFLEPALDVLAYLHAKGLAHGHVKPSNLLAAQDCLKLSSDALLSIGAQAELQRPADVYDAPELRSAPVSARTDAWSLGATLVEALTQNPPVFATQQAGDPAIPDSLPEPFREIARHSLRRSENQRWSIGEIAARLNPAPLAAAATATTAMASAGPVAAVAPLSVPLSTEPAVPLAKMPAIPEAPVRRHAPPASARKSSPFDYFVPILLGAAVLIGLIFGIPKIFNFQRRSASTTASANGEPPPSPAAAVPVTKSSVAPNANKSPQRSAAVPSPAPAPAVLRTDSSSSPKAKSTADVAERGQVLDQVLPQAAPKALATIQGTVRVVEKVQVDAAGNVSDAAVDTPGPSKYFADLSEKAARQWQFASAEANGRDVPSEWLIRFEFSQSGVHAFAQQTTP